jgi:hypothetical protein
MNTYAILNSDNLIINIVLWDGESKFNVDGLVNITGIPGVGIGWSYIDGQFIDTRPAEDPMYL